MTYSPSGRQAAQLEEFLTIDELAARYKVSPDTIRKWRATDYGPVGIRVGRHVRFPRANVERFEREQLRGGPDATPGP